MAYALGVVLFALAILISVSLHEAGHMAAAKAFGMKVTQFFVGFGPTLWSFRRGETEYGIKGIPLGGFVKIVGMTEHDDDVDAKDEPRAMWRYPVWKRTTVMLAGAGMNFVLALVVLWLTAMFVGLPNPALAGPLPAHVNVLDCVVVGSEQRDCQPGDPAGPAKAAGLQNGDKVVSINGVPVATYADLVTEVRKLQPGPAPIVIERDGVAQQRTIDFVATERPPVGDPNGPTTRVAAMGVYETLPPNTPTMITYGPIASIGATADFTGDMAVATVDAMKRFPEKVPRLWAALTGEERDIDTPISVVGASRLGGEFVENNAWELFIHLFITFNFFVGVFQLLPILPLDGGHVAIAWFEKVRSWLYARLGKPDPGRVDYMKLMPVTYAIILIFGGFTVLTIAADIVNPITLFGR
jgi:membrane-associated protease RseP (regulator of RpoE activity)